jgi:hypothetical protein
LELVRKLALLKRLPNCHHSSTISTTVQFSDCTRCEDDNCSEKMMRATEDVLKQRRILSPRGKSISPNRGGNSTPAASTSSPPPQERNTTAHLDKRSSKPTADHPSNAEECLLEGRKILRALRRPKCQSFVPSSTTRCDSARACEQSNVLPVSPHRRKIIRAARKFASDVAARKKADEDVVHQSPLTVTRDQNADTSPLPSPPLPCESHPLSPNNNRQDKREEKTQTHTLTGILWERSMKSALVTVAMTRKTRDHNNTPSNLSA